MSAPRIRLATPADHPAILEIYNHYVTSDHATFDTAPFTLVERGPWFAIFDGVRHSLVIAEDESGCLGYAAAAPFRPKPAYLATVETTVYAAPHAIGREVGRLVMESLLERCDASGVHAEIAAISLPNPASERLHASLGYEPIGVMPQVGRKFDRWIDIRWYQRLAD